MSNNTYYHNSAVNRFHSVITFGDGSKLGFRSSMRRDLELNPVLILRDKRGKECPITSWVIFDNNGKKTSLDSLRVTLLGHLCREINPDRIMSGFHDIAPCMPIRIVKGLRPLPAKAVNALLAVRTISFIS